MSSSEDYRELLIGCGRDRRKRYSAVPHHPRVWRSADGPITLDVNVDVNPHLWCDLNETPPWRARAHSVVGIPSNREMGVSEKMNWSGAMSAGVFYELLSDYWDEIHAYQVLEHLGQQGDQRAFFAQFQELWRLLKPDGYLVAEVPSRFSGHLWGDPGHTRAIVAETLVFLDQGEYIRQCDSSHPTAMSDYRGIYKGDFKILDMADNREHFAFVLQVVKPSRWKAPL